MIYSGLLGKGHSILDCLYSAYIHVNSEAAGTWQKPSYRSEWCIQKGNKNKLITKAHVLSEGSRVLIIYGVVFFWKKPVCLHEWSWLQEIVLTESSHILNVKSAVENKWLVYWMLFVISWQFQMAIKMPFWLFVPFCDGSRFFRKGLCEGKKGLT